MDWRQVVLELITAVEKLYIDQTFYNSYAALPTQVHLTPTCLMRNWLDWLRRWQ